MTENRFDVLVAGAGPAGCAAALALIANGLSVAVVDAGESPEQPRMGESLPGVARVALHELGLWDSFARQPWRPSYVVRSSWGSDEVYERDLLQRGEGPDFHVDRTSFDAWLGDHAGERGAHRFRPARVASASWDGVRRVWHVELTKGVGTHSVTARCLVDATGRSAALSRKLGATRRRVDRLVGIARWFRGAECDPVVLVEATPQGWFYSAPTPNGELVALFVTDHGPSARTRARSGAEAFTSDGPLTRERLRGALPCGRARTYDASPALTEFDASGPWLPVGDAALSFDPMSGDGLCFALRSGLEAAVVIRDLLAGGAGGVSRYRTGARQVFELHLARRSLVYRSEERWRDSSFWRGRHAVPRP